MKGQGSIIATGAIRSIAGDRVMTISSTYDHRIIQGAVSGMFLRLVDQLLQGEEGFFGEIAQTMGVPIPDLVVPSFDSTVASSVETSQLPNLPSDAIYHVAAAMSLVKAHRTHGHRAARLDPLGSEPPGDPALDPKPLGLTPEIMETIPSKVLRTYVPGETLRDAYPKLRETYCGTIAYEIEHIDDHEERVWLRQVIESGEHRALLSVEERKQLLSDLTKVDGLERFLHRSYLNVD